MKPDQSLPAKPMAQPWQLTGWKRIREELELSGRPLADQTPWGFAVHPAGLCLGWTEAAFEPRQPGWIPHNTEARADPLHLRLKSLKSDHVIDADPSVDHAIGEQTGSPATVTEPLLEKIPPLR